MCANLPSLSTNPDNLVSVNQINEALMLIKESQDLCLHLKIAVSELSEARLLSETERLKNQQIRSVASANLSTSNRKMPSF
jgi:hypothetical protein